MKNIIPPWPTMTQNDRGEGSGQTKDGRDNDKAGDRKDKSFRGLYHTPITVKLKVKSSKISANQKRPKSGCEMMRYEISSWKVLKKLLNYEQPLICLEIG